MDDVATGSLVHAVDSIAFFVGAVGVGTTIISKMIVVIVIIIFVTF